MHTYLKVKGGDAMKSLKIYRICLVLLLVMIIGGGLWYCYESFQAKEVPQDGTLVRELMGREVNG